MPNVYITADADNLGKLIGRARLNDDVPGLMRLNNAINCGNQVFKSWAESKGGGVVEIGGDEASIEIPISALSELPKIKEQYETAVQATVTIGVGLRLSESAKALLVGKLSGKNQIRFYTPDCEEIIQQALKDTPSDQQKEVAEYLEKSAGHLEHFKDRKNKNSKDLPSDKMKLLGEIDHWKVYEVDGLYVRNNIDIDFTEGGSSARYQYIPNDEIWLDNTLDPTDATATLVHEVTEARAMMNDGSSYEKAHDIANEAESKFRGENPELSSLDFDLAQEALDHKLAKGADAAAGSQKESFAHKQVGYHKNKVPKNDNKDHGEMEPLKDPPKKPETTHAARDFEGSFHEEAQKGHAEDEAAQSSQNESLDQVKTQLAQILSTVKDQKPVLDQIKQVSPETYETITNLVNSVVEMAQFLPKQSK